MTRSKRADGVKSSRIELSTKVLDTEYKLRKVCCVVVDEVFQP